MVHESQTDSCEMRSDRFRWDVRTEHGRWHFNSLKTIFILHTPVVSSQSCWQALGRAWSTPEDIPHAGEASMLIVSVLTVWVVASVALDVFSLLASFWTFPIVLKNEFPRIVFIKCSFVDSEVTCCGLSHSHNCFSSCLENALNH